MKKYVLLIILIFIVSYAQSAEYVLKPHEKNDTVFFESNAKLEFIVGKTNSIEGSFSFDMDNPNDSLHGIIRVDLRTLKTQIAARDKDMREKYLETDRFPYAYFELFAVGNLPDKLLLDTAYSVTCEGYFYLHGVKNKLKLTLTIMVPSSKEENLIEVTAKFHVLLEDYDIERPQLVILKVARQININIQFSAFLTETIEKIKIPSIYN